MKVLVISTEAVPFAKSGGLGDVVGSLPKELKKQGVDARVMLPLYKSIKETYGSSLHFRHSIQVSLGWRKIYCGLYEMEYKGVIFYFLDNENYFLRDGYYGHWDDGERFAFYSKASLEILSTLDFEPDILHCNEWQTALVPVFLKTHYSNLPKYEKLRTVFTIHNIEYQGRFGKDVLVDLLGLTEADGTLLEMDGSINFMKGAIVTCDKLTTVSPTYAQELKNPFFGRGLDWIIRENEYKLSGIINGIDYELYNPYRDKTLTFKYSKNTPEKKGANKETLQRELGLEISSTTPLIAMVGRLVEHKGIGLVTNVFDDMMAMPSQYAILGTGEQQYENFFRWKANQFKGRVSAVTAFSNNLANRIYAGADLFLMPSISEPCGLAQMIALRYGTIPIIRETGGLKDTVAPFNPITEEGNGITFSSINAHDMLDAVRRGQELYYNKVKWEKLMKNAFRSDFSWKKSTATYIKLYKELLG